MRERLTNFFNRKTLGGQLDLAGSLTIRMRSYYSRYHLWAAAHFARSCGRIERERETGFHMDHRAYATATIIESVAFLEAAINELLADAADGHHTEGWTGVLEDSALMRMQRMWPQISRASMLDKYQITLTLADKDPLNTGSNPYQDASLLIKLRNRLVHFRPESLLAGQPDDAVGDHEIERGLKKKFEANRLLKASGNPWFPDKCLGHGSSEWAVRSSLAFADDFFVGRMGIKPNYDSVRDELGTT